MSGIEASITALAIGLGGLGILVILLIVKVAEYKTEVARHGAALIKIREEVLKVNETLKERINA